VVQSPAVNYSQPIVTAPASPEAPPTAVEPRDGSRLRAEAAPPVAEESPSPFDEARASFYQGDYAAALRLSETALAQAPSDTTLHEFHALVLFATKQYRDSAANLYAVLSVAPGWDWTTMSSLYPSVDVYTEQLRALEDYAQQDPRAPEGHFLLAYHYMTTGHRDTAAEELNQVVALVPNDQVSRQLLEVVSGNGEKPETAPDAKAMPPQNVVGDWTAATGGDGTIELSLKDDGAFTWKLTRQQKTQEFDGKYELAGANLILNCAGRGTMVGKVNAPSANEFNFRMLGGPPNDPGLVFSK
jgi:tetratricopeptide (TPR) repeat protein